MFWFSKILDSEAVTFMLNDDIARVTLDVAATLPQSMVLMPLDYRIWLPDHKKIREK